MRTSIRPYYLLSICSLIGLFTQPVLAADPPTYPLVCRGGKIQFKFDSHPLGRKKHVGERVKLDSTFCFTKGRGASHQGLLPGQCSWVDRALRNEEPSCVCDRLSTGGSKSIAWVTEPDNRRRTAGHDGRPKQIMGYITSMGGPSYWSNLRNPDHYLTLQVFKERQEYGRDCLRVKRLGP